MYVHRQPKLIIWGPHISYDVAVAEVTTLGAHIWDYRANILDVGMTPYYSQYALAHLTP